MEKNNLQSKKESSWYDYLTDLPSMTYFFELAESGKENILMNGGEPMLLYFDFRGMKFFNTNYGFVEGDKLLQSFAQLLVSAFGKENCGRMAADHFAAITEETGLEEKLNQIFREFGSLFDGKTPPVHVGIYPYRIEDVPTSTACDRAKLACKQIKGSYSSGFNYYSAQLREDAVLRQYIIEHIDIAIREKWIQVYLQPIIRAVNERVCDVEALARWNDPERGLLSPAGFIPALEETGLIYKLDLYMVEQIIELIKMQKADGVFVVPYSINLSRSDFEACDIVEEIRKRIDEAGISHDRLPIEITESVIGSDFEFMKTQVERFRKLGFPVWMDDFGSGYSSMEVLQSFRFDLIKFDMSFMRRLEDDINGKVLLTELMRMATSLGVDTICEGVETESQVRFLREIGCSKLQGYYYFKPVPYETIRMMKKEKTLIEHENPEESDYYESIGRLNLYDLGAVARDKEDGFHNVFNTLPMAIIEIKDDTGHFVRSNRSYQEFVKRKFGVDIVNSKIDFTDPKIENASTFFNVLKQYSFSGNREFVDARMADGSVIHSFIRRLARNPVSGNVAIAIAVLSITEPDEDTTYAEIARSLATDYYNIYVIDLESNDYIEYSSLVGGEELSVERHGKDFFESAKRDAMIRIYEKDRESFLSIFTKEKVLQDLDRQGVFTTTYRLIDTGTPMYVNMKITRMYGRNRAILGISIIDAHMKQLEEEKRLREEKRALGRIAALSPDYIVLYTVDPETGHYTQYSPKHGFEDFDLATQGEDFFRDVILDAPKAIAPEDIERHLRVLTKDNMLRTIKEKGFFEHHYHLLLEDSSVPVILRATLIQDEGGKQILLGVSNDEKESRRKMEERIRNEEIQKLNREMSALADIFEAMTLIDLKTGQMLLLRTNEFHNSLLEDNLTDYNGRIQEISKRIASDEAGELLSRFMDPSTYEVRLKDLNSISHDFLDNRGMWVRFQMIAVDRDEEGHLWHIIWAVESINEERKQQNYLRKLAETDSLSQLRNRSSGEAGVRQRLLDGEKGVLLIMDVDDFKIVNDTCGHDVGDRVIVAVADCIRAAFRDSDITFRLGGDEYAAFLSGVEQPEQAESLIDRLTKEIDQIAIPELGKIHIHVSVGSAFYPEGDNDSFEALYQRADKKMYENKRKNKIQRRS